MSANQFPVWTCSFLMKFSQLLVPSHSFSVWEYNYTQNAYSSLCLPAAYSVRCISHEAEEMRSLCLYLSVIPPECLYACLSDYPGSGSRWHGKQVTTTQLPKRNSRWAPVFRTFVSFFFCLSNTQHATLLHIKHWFSYDRHLNRTVLSYMLTYNFKFLYAINLTDAELVE